MKRNRLLQHKLNAFSLTELLVVLVIIGILILLALPNLMPLISKAKSTEAKTNLAHIRTLQQTYFYEHSKYADDLNAIGFEARKTVEEGGNANYVYEIVEASPSGYTIRATAVVDFDGDGTMNVWEIDQDEKLVETVQD